MGRWLILVCALMPGVICEEWKVTLPRRIMGVEGSCVLVPCSFQLPIKHEPQLRNCSGEAVWKRGHLYGSTTRTAILVGDVTDKNCTTVFQNFREEEDDIYFFRLNCENKLTFSFEKGVHITVNPGDAPPRFTSVTLLSNVTEGDQVTLQCVAMVPCPLLPPSISWDAPQSRRQEQSQIMQNSDRLMMLKSTLMFIASAHHHNQTITCSVSYPLSAGGNTVAFTTSHSLAVLYGPRWTSAELSVPGPVSEGRVVVFTCSSDANPPVTKYTWFSNTNGTGVKVGEGQMLPLQVMQTHSGLYQCRASNERGTNWSNLLVLEVHSHSETGSVFWISAVCGVVSILSIFALALICYKYWSVLRKLKKMKQREEHIYSDLQNSTITPDYDNLKPRQMTVKPHPEPSDYENTTTTREHFKQHLK